MFNRVNFLGGGSNPLNAEYNPGNVVFDTPSGSTASTIVSATPAGNFGQLNSAADARQMQLGIKLSF